MTETTEAFVKDMDAWNAPEIGKVMRTRGRLHLVVAVEKVDRRLEAFPGIVTEVANAACRVTLRPLTESELSERRRQNAGGPATVRAAPRFCGMGA